MHQVLQITEIIELILGYTSPLTTAACARVCRAWSEPAFDRIWCHVPRVDAIFKLLGPMERNKEAQYCFTQPHISPERWDRFFFYSNRIRHIEYVNHLNDNHIIHPNSLATVAISRPSLHLLPKLTHITWRNYTAMPPTGLMLTVLFMSLSLQSVAVYSPWYSHDRMFPDREFFRHIVARSPHIRHLSLITENQTHPELNSALTKSIGALHDLRSVSLSDTYLTTGVLEALSTCPHLKVISHVESKEYTHNISLPVLQNGAFPNFKEIHLRVPLVSMINWLQPPFPAACLQRLSITTNDASHTIISGFLETVGNCCCNLQSLELNVRQVESDIKEPLSFAVLNPLLTCKSLASLSIITPLLLDLDNSHVALMASNWSQLRKLHLAPQPWPYFCSHPIRLTLEVLPILSRLRPEIEHLGLYIHPTIPTDPHKPLPNLQKLALGLKTIHYNLDDFAFFLTEATPLTCTLVVDHSSSWTSLYPPVIENVMRSYVSYLEAGFSRVKMMRKVAGLYRDRIDTLRREIQRLTTSFH
ncbi:hypothetical protein BDZ94DRAFT_1262686 [Collybia nuda]|uniref:F-box domain-containing protein n=1 Tax=Collybia nuda TaxID=64659 RepID=A0A9P5Y3Y7_9AGAR|nr:hypothetical protein BDZ94DRAFT_1262686 [Collybia nuda]